MDLLVPLTTLINRRRKISTSVNTDVKKISVSDKKLLLNKWINGLSNLKWQNVILMTILHIAAIISYLICCLHVAYFKSILFTLLIGILSGLGMSAGAHRLWAHRSFKAKWPLKIWLLFFQTMTMNGSAFSYARDHRTHHKHTDTERDPKNPARGLFYAHIGWWLVKKSDTVKEAGSKLNFDDLYKDRLLMLQHRYYIPLFIILGIYLPVWIPMYFWNENFMIAISLCILRITIVLHHLFTVNSLAHYIGIRPYDFRIRPTDSRLVNYLSFGEGNHNFHHVFAMDYRSNERSQWDYFNPLTLFIELNLYLGLATDPKITSPEVIESTIQRIGVPALHDPPLPPLANFVNSVLDWILGLVVDAWPLYPALFYKLATSRQIFI